MFRYQAFQLHINVPFYCPELLEADERSQFFPKVNIRFATVPEYLDTPIHKGPVYEANEQEFLIKIDSVGKFLIRNGNEITIEKKQNVNNDLIRLFLFGSAMGALLNQKEFLTLHASAIKTSKGAVLFIGESGAGKSTTLHEFIGRGYAKLSDDTAPLYFDPKQKKIMVLPAYPQSKIWQDSCEMLNQDMDEIKRIRPEINKFAISTKTVFHNEVTPLFAIYHLMFSNLAPCIDMKELKNNDKFKVLHQNTYRRRYIEQLKLKQHHFRISALASSQAIIKTVSRPSGQKTLKQLADCIEKDFYL